ncbi:MAG: DUF1080 domain-containing protein [Mariniblastus sp.]|nr:DUF1080 domain-containing protein [Mariniblastus sp.]
MKRFALNMLALAMLVATLGLARFTIDEYNSGIVWPEPAAIQPGNSSTAPSDAIVLFDGKNLDAWKNGDAWKIRDGYAEVSGKTIQTKQAFGDCQLHLEFATPTKVKGKGQGRGNSGVYLMGKYEVQILDSFENPTYFDGQCGALYKQQPPMVNASRGPGEWQSFDIVFTAPRFDEQGELKQPAFVTVLHNGVLIHNHYKLPGGTFWDQPPHYKAHPEKLPITLQNHGNPLRFRNIWIRENIHPLVGKQPEAKQ